jgi:PTS system nitrogen regulatory IIA component
MAAMVDAKDVSISNILKQKYVALNLESSEKENILAELVDVAASSGKVKNKKALLTALLEREKLGSTGIGNGVGIPHTKVDGAKEPILVFGRAQQGVDFNSLDGGLTYIFFVLISPKEEVGRHLKILARLSHIIKDKFTVGQLRKAKTQAEVLKIVEDAEKHLNR